MRTRCYTGTPSHVQAINDASAIMRLPIRERVLGPRMDGAAAAGFGSNQPRGSTYRFPSAHLHRRPEVNSAS